MSDASRPHPHLRASVYISVSAAPMFKAAGSPNATIDCCVEINSQSGSARLTSRRKKGVDRETPPANGIIRPSGNHGDQPRNGGEAPPAAWIMPASASRNAAPATRSTAAPAVSKPVTAATAGP